MIWHFFEVWLVFLVVFAVGCWLGALLHVGLAAGPAAVIQDNFANAVGDRIDHLKWWLGLAPDWRPEFRQIHGWPDLEAPQDRATVEGDEPAEAAYEQRHRSALATDDGLEEDAGAVGESLRAAIDFEDGIIDESDAVSREGLAGDETGSRETDTMRRPAALSEPRSGVPDNLQRIWGIGKRNEALLNSLGIYHFGQIASWTPAEARWVASRLTFPERLERDNWIGQAIVLATGGDPSAVSPSNLPAQSEENEC